MAEKDKLDLGEEKAPPNNKKMLFVIIGAVSVLLIVVLAALYFLGVFSSKEEDGESQAEDSHHASESHGKKKKKSGKKQKEESAVVYAALDPPFIVNFKNNPEARLLQIGISFATSNTEVAGTIKKHIPMIKNNLLLLLASQDPAVLKTSEGKEALRAKIQETVNAVVEEQTGHEEGVETVFFTSFITQ